MAAARSAQQEAVDTLMTRADKPRCAEAAWPRMLIYMPLFSFCRCVPPMSQGKAFTHYLLAYELFSACRRRREDTRVMTLDGE